MGVLEIVIFFGFEFDCVGNPRLAVDASGRSNRPMGHIILPKWQEFAEKLKKVLYPGSFVVCLLRI